MVRLNRKEILFFSGFILNLATLIIETSVWGENDSVATMLKYVRYLSYLFVLIKILLDQIEQFEIIYVVASAGIVVLTTICSDNKTFLFYLLFIVAARGINFTKIVKVSLTVQVLLLLLVTGCSVLEIIPDYIFDVTTRARHSYGFQWTTTGPILFFFMTAEYIYLRKEKMHWLECLVLQGIHLFFYWRTDSRMCFFMATLMLIFFGFYNWGKRTFLGFPRISHIFLLVPILVSVFSLGITYFYNPGNPLLHRINNLVSNRLQLGKSGMENYGITLFGTKIEWIGHNFHGYKGTYNFVDSSYVHLLLENGIIVLALIILCYSYIIYNGVIRNDGHLVWIICFILIFSITEPRLVNLAYHPFILMAVAAWSEGKAEIWRRGFTEEGFLPHEKPAGYSMK